MTQSELQKDVNKLFTQIAVVSDQATRAERRVDELDVRIEDKMDKIDERIESKLDYIGDRIQSLTNTVTRLEAESKSNTKWFGWAIAGLLAVGDIVFNIVTRVP